MRFRAQSVLVVVVSLCLLAVSPVSQAIPQAASKGSVEEQGFTWAETYEGSGNSDGFITDINSTVGYICDKNFAINMGVPYFFFNPSTSKAGATSVYGMGNPYLGLKYSAKGAGLDFSTSLKGAIPTASTTKGLSIGHVTVDWSNHFATDSIPSRLFLISALATRFPTRDSAPPLHLIR